MVHPVNAYLYYFAVIASPSETVGAAISCEAVKGQELIYHSLP